MMQYDKEIGYCIMTSLLPRQYSYSVKLAELVCENKQCQRFQSADPRLKDKQMCPRMMEFSLVWMH